MNGNQMRENFVHYICVTGKNIASKTKLSVEKAYTFKKTVWWLAIDGRIEDVLSPTLLYSGDKLYYMSECLKNQYNKNLMESFLQQL